MFHIQMVTYYDNRRVRTPENGFFSISVRLPEELIMLVTFSTPVYANITMFGDVAIRLLKLMGHSGTVPGALLAEDVQPALERLQAGVRAEAAESGPEEPAEDDDGEPIVSLSHRALPLIELLAAAAKANRNVMWDKNS
jgi:hypothetical protein